MFCRVRAEEGKRAGQKANERMCVDETSGIGETRRG